MSIKITKLVHEEESMYRIEDFFEGQAQQVIVLTREELGANSR